MGIHSFLTYNAFDCMYRSEWMCFDMGSNENGVEYSALCMKVTHTYIYSFTSRKI